ncbi:uncharacterized protein LOC130450466 isoform X1 [Diorhabda sublineata]|uniref:uncharacterized protein LOC130450466 isoform X1 n=1 Tax=Diorhabda sublineata TaxID=1163346 RepID=UPI0024E0DF51|nr:uncharacterized protein LOC130450466 isoform X1 [Diorhabda sublineata]
MLIIILFIHFFTLMKCEFVIETIEQTCDLQLLKNLTVYSKDWEVTYKQAIIKFNLCGYLNDKDHHKYVAYIKKNNNFIRFANFSGSLDNKLNFHPVDNTTCKLSVNFDCLMFSKEPKLQVNDECNYQLSISSLSENCVRPYGMRYQNDLLDFRPLRRLYDIKFDGKNKFESCISFCNEIEDCKIDNNNCYVNGTKSEKIVTVEFDRIVYNNKFELHAHYFQHNKKKKIEVHITCKWFKNSTELKVLSAGKNTRLELESSLGCIKQPQVCQFTDKQFFYNLSDLYEKKGYWEVEFNITRKIYLNICGPLHFGQDHCSKSHSQICENVNGTYISKGRISSPLTPVVLEDTIVDTYTTGDECNKTQMYTTKLILKCSSVDGKPTFIKENGCEIIIGWNTTKACPKYDLKACPDKLPSSNQYDCVYKDIHKEFYLFYNLSRLYNPRGYQIRDPDDNNYLYWLNVCGPINLSEAPCKKNVMIAKVNLKEVNVRKKVISYGEQTNISTRNGSLIIDTAGGDFYNQKDLLTYYRANIQFECSRNIESEIFLLSKSESSLEFLWKTKYACPVTVETIRSCIFDIDPYTKLDFTNITKDSLLIQNDDRQYLFDLCGRRRESCDPSNCTYTRASKNVVKYHNKYNIEFILNAPCNIPKKFNRTLIELVCDNLLDNDHYNDEMKVENCTLMLQLRTNKICTNEPVVVPLLNSEPLENKNIQRINYDVIQEHSTKKVNCTLIGPHNNYVFDINQLTLDVNVTKCPAKSYNFDNKTITLLYNIPKSCHHSKDNLELIVELNCNDTFQQNKTNQFRCSRKMTFFLPETCKLLEIVNNSQNERGTISGGLITVYTLLSIFLVLLLIGISYRIYKRQLQIRPYRVLFVPYKKDLDD